MSCYLLVLWASFGYIMDKKILYVDMDNVLVDFPAGIAHLDDETLKKIPW